MCLLLFHKIFASGLIGNVSIITPHSIVKLYKSATSGIQSYVRIYVQSFAKLRTLHTKIHAMYWTDIKNYHSNIIRRNGRGLFYALLFTFVSGNTVRPKIAAQKAIAA